MAVVTLTGHRGALGAVPRLLAAELRYRLVDSELLDQAAAVLQCSPQAIADLDEQTGGLARWLERWMSMLTSLELKGGVAVPGLEGWNSGSNDFRALVPRDEQYVDALRKVITVQAREGNVVLVGHGAHAILAGWPDVTHVRLVCPLATRIERVVAQTGLTLLQAQEAIAHSDHERETWYWRYFGIDFRAPQQYHLVMNTGAFWDALTVRMLSEAVQAFAACGRTVAPAVADPP